MKKCTSLTKWLTVFLLIFTFAAAPSFKAQAADLILIEDDQDAELPMQEEDGSVGLPVIEDDTAAPALPESGLPVLSDYEDTSDSPRLSRGVLPSSYDSRSKGYVTSVKDQDPWGTCWAFGALAAGESSLIKNGAANNSVDLSEMHLSYFFFHSVADPMKLTSGDKVINQTGSKYLDTGGNNLFTMFALSRWVGAAAEETVPYGGHLNYVNESLAYADIAHLQNARFVNTCDRNSVKELIMQYGAVSTSLFYHSGFQSDNGAYYFPYRSYLDSYGRVTNTTTNHIVSIVGWDDNYSRDNFTAVYKGRSIKPTANGAWMAKNSYGTGEGDNGYIYISYADVTMSDKKTDFLSYAFDMESAENYDHNYQYDGSYGSTIRSLTNGSSVASRYTVKGISGTNERLDAVGFSVYTPNVNYSIQVYKSPSSKNPTSGIPMFSTPQTGRTTYGGYYTIPLNKKLVFQKGDVFSVVITLSAVNDSSVYYFVDCSTNNAGLTFISSGSAGQSFYESGSTWHDMDSWSDGASTRIKAFTTNTGSAATKTDTITTSIKTPSISSLTSVAYNKIQIKWKKIAKAKSYQIYRSTSRYGTYKRIKTTSKLSFTDGKRASGTTYYYKIRATRKIGGKTCYTYFSNVKATTARPAKALITSAKAVGKYRAKLKWKKVSGASGYELHRSTSKSRAYRRVKVLTKGSIVTYTNKAPKKRNYYYKVRAYRLVNGRKVYGDFSAAKRIHIK